MSLGQLLGGAGVVAGSMRTAEDRARASQADQLRIEELNRLDQLRREMLTAAPVAAPVQYNPTGMLSVEQVQPKAGLATGGTAGTAGTAKAGTTSTAGTPAKPTVSVPATTAGRSPVSAEPQMSQLQLFKALQAADRGTPIASKGASPAQAAKGFTAEDAALAGSVMSRSAPSGVDRNALATAQRRAESNFNPNAVSPVGATGIMQVMPATAMKPGFGLPTVFEFARQQGVPVGKETRAEAERLLKMPQIGGAYGDAYTDAMSQKYGGNTDYILAAYNWGPGNTDKWIAAGADPAKLPEETRNYIAKIKAELGQPTEVSAAPTQVAQAGGVATDAPSAFYLADPQAIPRDMQVVMQQRQELEQLAGMYQRAGMGQEFMQVRQQMIALDNNMGYLQGMQGLQEFSLANDPRRLASVWSQFAGVPVGIQPRSDGTFNILVNGERVREGVSATDVANSARLGFDQTYRQQQAATGAEVNMERAKAQLEIQKENAKQTAQMVRELATTRMQGNNAQALEWFKMNMGWDIKPTGAGDGTLIIRPPGGEPYVYNPAGRTVEIDGVKVESNSAYPIAGLPTYGGINTR